MSRLSPVLLAATVLAACGGSATPVAPTRLVLSDYSIATPASIPASMAAFTVVNTGKEAHQAALVRLDSGKTYSDFQNAMKGEAHGPPPAWIVWVGGAHALPGDSNNVTLALEAGSYVWYCLIPGSDGVPHIAKGMSAPMTVSASTAPIGAAPVSDVDVTMHDYQWDLSTPITAGKHTLRFATAPGSQPHEAAIVRLQPGKSGKDFAEWAMKMAGPPPIESLSGVPVMQAGQVDFTTIDFKPGNYAIICFVPDSKDGQPHAVHGMVKDFTVQ